MSREGGSAGAESRAQIGIQVRIQLGFNDQPREGQGKSGSGAGSAISLPGRGIHKASPTLPKAREKALTAAYLGPWVPPALGLQQSEFQA